MAKTLSIILGAVYALLGLIGFASNPLVGVAGFFATNTALNLAFLVVGVVLLAVGIWADTAALKVWDSVVGIVLIVVSLLGFAVAGANGTVLGMAVNGADNWLNLVLGIVLLLSGLFERNTATFLRHATQ